MLEHGPTQARRLGEPDRLRDRRLEERQPVAILDFGEDLARMRRPAVEHGGDDAEHTELLVGELAHVLHGLEQLADAAVAERLALKGHDDGLGCGQPVDRQHPERRRAVDEHGVVVAARPGGAPGPARAHARSGSAGAPRRRPGRSSPARGRALPGRREPSAPRRRAALGGPGRRATTCRARRDRIRGSRSGTPAGRGRRRASACLARPARHRDTARLWSWPRRPSGWRPRPP